MQSINLQDAYKKVYGEQKDGIGNTYKLAQRPEIKEAIRELLTEYVESKGATLSRVQQIVALDVLSYYTGFEFDYERLKSDGFGWLVKGVRTNKLGQQEFVFMDKDRALEQLVKIQGLYDVSAIVQNNYYTVLDAEKELGVKIDELRSRLVTNGELRT